MGKPRIEEWFIGKDDCLFGRVYGHPLLPDGAPICTHLVVDFDSESGNAMIKNSPYILGHPRYKSLTEDNETYIDENETKELSKCLMRI